MRAMLIPNKHRRLSRSWKATGHGTNVNMHTYLLGKISQRKGLAVVPKEGIIKIVDASTEAVK